MKTFRNFLFAVLGLAAFASCSSDDDKIDTGVDKTAV